MTVGVKYCGGCNPRYDRKQGVEAVAREFPQLQFSTAVPNVHYDFLLVLCGCSAACADFSYVSATKTYVLFTQDHVQSCILSLKKET